jgi:hypothetical protein
LSWDRALAEVKEGMLIEDLRAARSNEINLPPSLDEDLNVKSLDGLDAA